MRSFLGFFLVFFAIYFLFCLFGFRSFFVLSVRIILTMLFFFRFLQFLAVILQNKSMRFFLLK